MRASGAGWTSWVERSDELARTTVVVLGGGTSVEREVSLTSSRAIAEALREPGAEGQALPDGVHVGDIAWTKLALHMREPSSLRIGDVEGALWENAKGEGREIVKKIRTQVKSIFRQDLDIAEISLAHLLGICIPPAFVAFSLEILNAHDTLNPPVNQKVCIYVVSCLSI